MNEIQNNPDFEEVKVEIQEAKPEDAKAIATLRKTAWLETYPCDDPDINITREDIEKKDFDSEQKIKELEGYFGTSDGTAKTWVAREGHEIVGYCTAFNKRQHEIRAIYVHPDHQGKGIGKKLMYQMFDWLGSGKDMHLYVAQYSNLTIEFYERLGFEKTDAPVPEGYEVNGKPIPLVEMTKFNNSDKSNQ